MCPQHPGLRAMIYSSVGGKVRKSEDQKALEAFSKVTELLLCNKKKETKTKGLGGG